MAYLKLLYRRKAGNVNYPDEPDELLKMPDQLVDKVKEIKQRHAESPRQMAVRIGGGQTPNSGERTRRGRFVAAGFWKIYSTAFR